MKHNTVSCQEWYVKMKQNPEKLAAYRERKRIAQRRYRNGTTRQNKEPKRQQEEQRREVGGEQLDEVVREPALEANATETLI